MELQRKTHHVYRLMYHFVWIPKYRHKVFKEPYRAILKEIIQKIGYDYDIHMVVRGVPKMSPSDVMQIIKSLSPREFFSKIPRNEKAIFLGWKIMDTELFCGNDRKCR